MKRITKTFKVLIVLFVLILLVVTLFNSKVFDATYEPIKINEYAFHHGNHVQHESTVLMACLNNKLYFYSHQDSIWNSTGYDGFLSVFESSGIRQVYEINGNVFAILNGYVYYDQQTTEDFDRVVCSYDFVLGQESTISTISRDTLDGISSRDCLVTEAGTVFVSSVNNSRVVYYPINNTTIGDPEVQPEVYYYGANKFTVARDIHGNINIVCYSSDGERHAYHDKLPEGRKTVIPCDNGLVIHNEYYGNLVYYIDGTTGELVELFTVPCDHSTSALNVHEQYVFLSFKRYADYNAIWGSRYNNDSIEGTYRINLEDYSVLKISDQIYNGMFIFDDTGIFDCNDKCNIYKVDFDGNVIMTLLEH